MCNAFPRASMEMIWVEIWVNTAEKATEYALNTASRFFQIWKYSEPNSTVGNEVYVPSSDKGKACATHSKLSNNTMRPFIAVLHRNYYYGITANLKWKIKTWPRHERQLNTDWKVLRIKTRIDINDNTSLNTDEYGALFSPYSVVFYPVDCIFFLRCCFNYT